MGGNQLTVDFIGERYTVDQASVLTFGRAADIVIDAENLYLHRVVGRFLWHSSLWWLENLATQVELETESDRGLRARLAPCPPGGDSVSSPLVGSHSFVRFVAGDLRYELEVLCTTATTPTREAPVTLGRETSQFGQIELTEDERALLVVLAEPWLREPGTGAAEALPTNREVADRLGWTLTKVNRKLDYLCVRLTRVGVRGVQGGRGAEALNRRARLVEHAVLARLITVDDLLDPGRY